MRKTVWITLVVFVCSMALCTLSNRSVNRVVNHARHLRTEAIERVEAGDVQGAEVTLVQLAQYLRENQGWLEVLCEHEDLHEMKEQLIDAQASIEFGIEDDFYQAIYRFGERLEHIADTEHVRLSNLY